MFGLPSNRGASGTGTIAINRSTEQVFDFIARGFFENYPKWSPEVQELELLSEPPLQLNSLVRQVRIDYGQRSETTFKVSSYRPNQRIAFEGVSNAFRCSYDFFANNASITLVRFTFEIPELELFLLPFEKLVSIAVQEGARRNVGNLKRVMESG